MDPLLLSGLVITIAQKVGEKWIDRIATEIDSFSVNLFKQAINDPTKEQEVKAYFRDNPTVAEKIEQNVAKTLQSSEIAASIGAAVVPSGDILGYYAELINWIVQNGSKLDRHFVLKGFLNGEFFLSYFIFDPRKVGNSEFASVEESRFGSNHISVRATRSHWTHEGIFVERMKSAEARDKKFEEMNRKARLSHMSTLSPKDYRFANLVYSIYPHYVSYERFGDISALSSKKQE